MKIIKQNIFPMILAFLSAMALSLTIMQPRNAEYNGIDINNINGVGLASFIVLLALAVFYIRKWNTFRQAAQWITHIGAVIFSVCMFIGLSYSRLNRWAFPINDVKQFIITILCFIGYFILFDICLAILYHRIQKQHPFQTTAEYKTPVWINNHYQLFSFIIIVVFWLPYLLANLPASVPYDGYRQLNMFFGIEPISNHHPWVLTEFFGFLMTLGRHVSDNFGVFLICIVLFLIEAFCYAVVCAKIRTWKTPRWFNVCTLLFFAILPPFGAYAQIVMKDGIFCALFALFFVLYTDLCIAGIQKRQIAFPLRTFAVLFLIELLVCLTRNNGLYLVIPADILLLFFVLKGRHRWVLAMTFCVFICYYGVEHPLAERLNILPGSQREMLTIPFQQTARYLKEYPDDVTEEEKEAISAVLYYDGLARRYQPEISDKVKDTFNDNASKEELNNYFSAWLSMFKRHPNVYFAATLNNTYGYYYPFHNCTALGAYQLYIQGPPLATEEFDIHYITSEQARAATLSYTKIWQQFPGLSQLTNPGTCTWVLLICAGYLIYVRKRKGLLVLAAPFLNVAICIASPVNGYLRYSMPLLACLPMIIAWCLIYTKKEQKMLQKKEEKWTE